MTFKRRIFAIVTFVLVVFLTISSSVSVFNVRAYFAKQMSVLSQDAATSLAFALSQPAIQADSAQIDTMMNVIFDSGYYLSISYIDSSGALVSSRARKIEIENVPQWFVRFLSIPTPSGKAEVQSGWYQLGEVHVVAHPGYGYQKLWQVCSELFWLLCVFIVLAYGFVGGLMHVLMRPLQQMKQHAEAIAKEDFSVAAVLPKAPEFRVVVMAMNKMAQKLHLSFTHQLKLIASLQKVNQLDELTGYVNRQEFEVRVNAWLSSEKGQSGGALVFVCIRGLESLNNEQGREFGDRLIIQVGKQLNAMAKDDLNTVIGRRSGGQFALFLPGIFLVELTSSVALLSEWLVSNGSVGQADIAVGVGYSAQYCTLTQYFVAADESLRASIAGSGDSDIAVIGERRAGRSAQDWRPVLLSALDSSDITFNYQPAFYNDEKTPHHFEVLCRIKDGEHLVSAGVFWPLVERFGLNEAFDRYVFEHVSKLVQYEKPAVFSLNVSLLSLRSFEFRVWLLEELVRLKGLGSRFILELPSSMFAGMDAPLLQWLNQLSSLGVALNIDSFGLHTDSIVALRKLPINFVKLDRRYVTDIHKSVDNQFYVQMLTGVCDACGVKMIAEGVESEQDLIALRSLGVKGFQGFYFGKPRFEI